MSEQPGGTPHESERVALPVTYDNFPCKVPLTEAEKQIARLLYDTSGAVPYERFEMCATIETLRVKISELRKKLLPGHRIVAINGGYQLVYEDVIIDDKEEAKPCNAVAIAKAKLESRVQELRTEIEGINAQLQDLNETKAAKKQELQMMEVGAMALRELEEG